MRSRSYCYPYSAVIGDSETKLTQRVRIGTGSLDKGTIDIPEYDPSDILPATMISEKGNIATSKN